MSGQKCMSGALAVNFPAIQKYQESLRSSLEDRFTRQRRTLRTVMWKYRCISCAFRQVDNNDLYN